jgi:hypothetical protein
VAEDTARYITDILRIYILAGIAVTAYQCFDILIRYFGKAKEGELLPQHIWLIVASYLSYVSSACAVTVVSFGKGLTVSIFYNTLAVTLGVLALSKVRRHVLNK